MQVDNDPSIEKNKEARLTAYACAAIALFVSIVAVESILVTNDWNVSTLVRMTPADPLSLLAMRLDPDFALVLGGHYDGVYYYAIALDPLALGEAHRLIDLAPHRYGHPGLGWLAWLLSFRRPYWIPEVLLGLGIAGMAIAAFFTARIANRLGASPWAGLLIALNPGLVFAVTADTSEAVAAALLSLSLYLWLKERRVAGGLLMIALCFFKFQMILIPVGIGIWELIKVVRGQGERDIWRRLLILGSGPALFSAWQIYVYTRFEELSTSLGPSLLTFPFVGFMRTIADQGHIAEFIRETNQIASAQLPILLCTMVLFGIGVVRSARLRDEFDCIFLLQGLLVLSLTWWNLYFPKELLRALALPVPLLIAVLHTRSRPGPTASMPD